MSNDAAKHEFGHVMALVQQQMQDLAVMEQKRAALTATATAADGTVEVTVDAQRVVTRTVIAESYLEEFEFVDLGGYVTTAAQRAGAEIEQMSAALLAPLTQRREEIASASGSVVDLPDFQELFAGLRAATGVGGAPHTAVTGGDEETQYPTVRR